MVIHVGLGVVNVNVQSLWSFTQNQNSLLGKCQNVWGAVLLFIPYLWISNNHFRISIIQFLDIHNSIYGYPKIDFRISINQFLDILKSAEYSISIFRLWDILKSNYGYPKIGLYFWTDFRISII